MRYMKKNVALIGFMGTGKSSTGKDLSSRLGCAFVDLDRRIEEMCGMRIPEIFEKYGEDYFREQEHMAVKEVSARKGIVISTGGGTVKNPENIRLLRQRGFVICLTADVDTILSRTMRVGNRPVLDSADRGDRRKAIIELLESRREMYSNADYTVDTSQMSPFQVVEDICRYLKRRGAFRG